MHALARSAFVKTVLPVLLTIGTMAAADFTGTWKFNPAKSQYRRDLSEEMLTIKQTGPDTYTSSVDFVTKSGEKRHQEIVRICDGKEHPSPRSGAAKGEVLICELGHGATNNQFCRASEPHDSHGDQALYQTDKRFLKEAGQPQSCLCAALRLLQFLPHTQVFACDACNRGGCHRSHLEFAGTASVDCDARHTRSSVLPRSAFRNRHRVYRH